MDIAIYNYEIFTLFYKYFIRYIYSEYNMDIYIMNSIYNLNLKKEQCQFHTTTEKVTLLIIEGDAKVLFDYVNSLESYTILHTYNTLTPKCIKYDIGDLTKHIFNSFNIIVFLNNSFNYLLNEWITSPTQIGDVFISGKIKIIKHKYTKYIHIHDTLDISKIYSIVYPSSIPDKVLSIPDKVLLYRTKVLS